MQDALTAGMLGVTFFAIGVLFGTLFVVQAVVYSYLERVEFKKKRWARVLSVVLLSLNAAIVLGAAYGLRILDKSNVEMFAIYLAMGAVFSIVGGYALVNRSTALRQAICRLFRL